MSKSSEVAISVKSVSKSFRLPHEKYGSVKNALFSLVKGNKRTFEKQKVLQDVSFDVKKGEFFGIVGRNGSGKSTMLKLLAGIYSPDQGEITVKGKLTPFIELGVGFNPELTGRENVFLNGALLGFDRKEMDEMYEEIVAFAELERFMDQQLKNYSSGMQVRLAFSIAIRANSSILLLDEVLAVGDYEFQQKCFEYFKQLKKDKKTVILVSHDINSLRQFCTSGVHLRDGKIMTNGTISDVLKSYAQEGLERAEHNPNKLELKKSITGSGEATILEVYASSLRGDRKTVVRPREKFVINFKIKAKENLANPVVGMIFSDQSGKVVFATNSLDRGLKTRNMDKGCTYLVKFVIENIFDDSVYVVSGAIASSDRTTLFSRVESAFQFRSSGWHMSAKAPVYPDHDIEIVSIQSN